MASESEPMETAPSYQPGPPASAGVPPPRNLASLFRSVRTFAPEPMNTPPQRPPAPFAAGPPASAEAGAPPPPHPGPASLFRFPARGVQHLPRKRTKYAANYIIGPGIKPGKQILVPNEGWYKDIEPPALNIATFVFGIADELMRRSNETRNPNGTARSPEVITAEAKQNFGMELEARLEYHTLEAILAELLVAGAPPAPAAEEAGEEREGQRRVAETEEEQADRELLEFLNKLADATITVAEVAMQVKTISPDCPEVFDELVNVVHTDLISITQNDVVATMREFLVARKIAKLRELFKQLKEKPKGRRRGAKKGGAEKKTEKWSDFSWSHLAHWGGCAPTTSAAEAEEAEKKAKGAFQRGLQKTMTFYKLAAKYPTFLFVNIKGISELKIKAAQIEDYLDERAPAEVKSFWMMNEAGVDQAAILRQIPEFAERFRIHM